MNDRLCIRIIPQQWLTPSFFVSLLSQPLFLNRFNSECFTVSDEPTLDTDGIIDIFIMKDLDWSTAAVSFCKRCQSLECHATTPPTLPCRLLPTVSLYPKGEIENYHSQFRPPRQLSPTFHLLSRRSKSYFSSMLFCSLFPLSRQSFSGKHIAC